MTFDELRAVTLALPREERAKLAQELIRSLEGPAEDAEDAWMTEVTRRASDVAKGCVTPVDWKVARKRIAERLHELRSDGPTPSDH